jgi:hypothetical protein
LIAAILALLGLSYLVFKVLSQDPAVDYPYVWLAGSFWVDGQSPYAPSFGEAGRALVPAGHAPQYWFYPPNWWPVATVMALLPYDASLTLWRSVSATLLVGGTAAVGVAACRARLVSGPAWPLAMLAFACLMAATPQALSLGQTSFLSFFGAALFVAAGLGRHRTMMAVALVLLMLKPQVGLAFCLFLLPRPVWWPSLAAAAVITLALFLPQLRLTGIGPFLDSYLAQLRAHEGLSPNHPLEMTGLRHLGWMLFGQSWAPLPLSGLAGLAVLAIGGRRRTVPADHDLELSGVIAVVCLVVPLHTYDMMLLAPLVILTRRFSVAARVFTMLGLAMVFRANRISEMFGLHDPATVDFTGSRLTTLGSLVIAGAVLFEAALRTRVSAGSLPGGEVR